VTPPRPALVIAIVMRVGVFMLRRLIAARVS
jgi:hypothetical protein